MGLDKEIVTRVCAQLTKYLLERSAEDLNISISKAEKYRVKIVSKVFLGNDELDLLKSYLSVRPQEVGYYYLPLIGEYGSEEDLAIIAMLLEELELTYDQSSHELTISFQVR